MHFDHASSPRQAWDLPASPARIPSILTPAALDEPSQKPLSQRLVEHDHIEQFTQLDVRRVAQRRRDKLIHFALQGKWKRGMGGT